jgi:hypothetical protein
MKFECADLERALAHSELMPEAREHLKTCAVCRREHWLWMELSSAAKELHEEWETPGLWLKIYHELEAERKPAARWWSEWRTCAIAAALLAAVLVPWLWNRQATKPSIAVETPTVKEKSTADRDFLNEQALIDVERSEAAYRKSIVKLSRLAEPALENTTSARAVNTREKLLMLDSAIADTLSNVASNRFNLRLQTTLGDLYREKQHTLQELLTRDQNN